MNRRFPQTAAALKREGFQGFVGVAALRAGGMKQVPSGGGVYLIIRESDTRPAFRKISPAGWLKGRDPTVSLATLRAAWLPGSRVLYIGKGNSLRGRLRLYLAFGDGKPTRHRGGRYIWQLKDSSRLQVAWKQTMPDVIPREAEIDLLCQFRDAYGRWPFANLVI